jgi:hypothetical protein
MDTKVWVGIELCDIACSGRLLISWNELYSKFTNPHVDVHFLLVMFMKYIVH